MSTTNIPLHAILIAALKNHCEPMDAAQLYALPAVQAHAASPNRVSDHLNALFRDGLVKRYLSGSHPDDEDQNPALFEYTEKASDAVISKAQASSRPAP